MMNPSALRTYRCPVSGTALAFTPSNGQASTGGELRSSAGQSYPITDGIVDFTVGAAIDERDASARQAYGSQAGEMYENAMQWLWTAFRQDEHEVRSAMLDRLDLEPGQVVLETGCGTGSDSELIAARLGAGELFLQDISPEMIGLCKQRLERIPDPTTQVHYSVATGSPLPFGDDTFDRVFHFGGLNGFSDIAGSLKEMARVTRQGGKIVVGDESVAPWLRQTEYGKIIINNNELFDAAAPLDKLPESARDVALEYIIGNAFYLISFRVGAGTPPLDLDLPHRGRRGGTMRSRYYGRLEGVSPEAKDMAIAAAQAAGKSLHDWLDEVVREKATAARRNASSGRAARESSGT